jgi:hypothetical protein
MNAWKAEGKPPTPATAAASPASAAIEARALADRYDQVATRIDGLHLVSPELVPRAQRYQKMSREAAAALRDVAQAVEQGDAEDARRRRIEFDDLASGEAPLVADINAVCR